MSDKPILFSGPMMNALRAGRKTQTRRVLNPQPEPWRDFYQEGGCQTTDWRFETGMRTGDGVHHRYGLWMHCQFHESRWQRLPYAPGDRLWVREAWRTECNFDHLPPRDLMPDGQQWRYEADGTWSDHDDMTAAPGRLRPGMFMPRWASRAFVTVTDTRVKRLQEISEEDATAEGLRQIWNPGHDDHRVWTYDRAKDFIGCWDARGAYKHLWSTINGAGSWDTNPWVAAYSLTVTLRNIDEDAL